MNFKLIVFIFGLICIKLISSSIINKFNINSNAEDIKVVGKYDEFNDNISILVFNKSETIKWDDRVYSELNCFNKVGYRFDGCTYGNKKYQSEVAICWNLNFKIKNRVPDFWCLFYNAKFSNKNIIPYTWNVYCHPDTTTQGKGNCRLYYSLYRKYGHSDDDDIPN